MPTHVFRQCKGVATGATSTTWALPFFYWLSQEVIIQMITHFATKYPDIHGLSGTLHEARSRSAKHEKKVPIKWKKRQESSVYRINLDLCAYIKYYPCLHNDDNYPWLYWSMGLQRRCPHNLLKLSLISQILFTSHKVSLADHYMQWCSQGWAKQGTDPPKFLLCPAT